MSSKTHIKHQAPESIQERYVALLDDIERVPTASALQELLVNELYQFPNAIAVISLIYGASNTEIQLKSKGLSDDIVGEIHYPDLLLHKTAFTQPHPKSGLVEKELKSIAAKLKTQQFEIFLLTIHDEYIGEFVIFGNPLSQTEVHVTKQLLRHSTLIFKSHSLRQIVDNESKEAITIQRITKAIASSLDLETISSIALGSAIELFSVHAAFIALIDLEDGNYKIQYANGLKRNCAKNLLLTLDKETIKTLSQSRRPIQYVNIIESPLKHIYDSLSASPLRSLVIAPIFMGDKLTGLLSLVTNKTRHFRYSEIRLCQNLTEQVGIAYMNADLKKITHEIEQTRNFMQDGLLVLGLNHRIEYFNDAARQLLRLKNDAIGETLTAHLIGKSANISISDADLEAALTSASLGNIDRTNFSVTGEDAIEYFEAVYSPNFDDAKEPIGILVSIRNITQLYLEKEKLASIQANLQDGLIVIGSSGRVEECNQEWTKLFGFENSISGKDIIDELTQATNLSFDRNINDLIKDVLLGKSMTCYGVNTATNRHFQLSFGPILISGQVTGAVATSRDITPLIDKTLEANEMTAKAQTHLRELSQLAELSSIVGFNVENIYERYLTKITNLVASDTVRFYLYDPVKQTLRLQQSTVIDADNATQSYKLGGDAIVPKAFADRRSVVEANDTPQGHKLALPIVHHSKILGVILVERTNKPYNDHDTKLLRLVATRLAVLVENANLYHDVNSRRERWEAVFRFTEEGIVIFDKNGLIVGFNPATSEMTQWGTAEAIGRPFSKVIKTVGNESINPGATPLARVLGEGITIAKSEQLIESRGGERLWTEISYSPIFDETGRVTSGIAVIHNTQKDREIEEIKSDFISIVSHELRTPLTAIKGFLSMIIKQDFGTLNEKQFHYLSRVYQSNQRMIDLVEDLLNATYIESGKIALSINPVAVENVLAEVMNELTGKAAASQVMVKIKRRQKLPLVLADETRLHQIILNLVDNAIKYSMPQTQVEVDFTVHGDELITTISDHGVGISKGQIDRLFTKFGRVYNPMSAQAGGTGLGLYIVKNLVESHGGRIWVTSQEGKGSKFRFSMPIAKQLPLLG
jgi:PAS domain S-box-containing protein